MPARKLVPRASSGLPPKKWTAEANVELLITIIKTYNVKVNYEQIAGLLGDVTAEAVKKHYLKLKGGKGGNMQKKLVGKKLEMDWKGESSDDDDWQGKGIKVEG